MRQYVTLRIPLCFKERKKLRIQANSVESFIPRSLSVGRLIQNKEIRSSVKVAIGKFG